jgi:hypothetical protein
MNEIIQKPEEEVVDITAISTLSVQQRVAQNEQLLRAIAPTIKKNHVIMQRGQSYVCVAGGIAIANALGFTIATDEVVAHNDDDGKYYSAVASLIDSTTGITIGKATGYVGMDEERWASAPLYARRSMTSTRAVARMLRQNFGHFYVALGHSDTPLEELPDIPDNPRPDNRGFNKPPVADAPDGHQIMHVTAVDEWSKEGADWTKYTITLAEGYSVTTFKDAFADIAKSAKENAHAVRVRFSVDEKYNTHKLEEISIVADDADVTKDMPTNDDVPF